ncbi:MAG: alpha/beta fold hydrolase [Vulcanimicrobiaceae bacterium]
MIEIDVAGSGKETILAVHGAPGTDHRLFRPELDRLGAFARVVYFDLPGHGRSSPPRDFRLETIAESLEEARIAATAEGVNVLGSSYGGFVALQYALAHPDRVVRLILVDTSASSSFRTRSIAIARERANKTMLEAFERLWNNALANDDDFRENWRILFPLYFAQATQTQIDSYAGRTSYNLATRRAILPTFEGYDVRASLAELRMPALVIVGKHDWITPPGEARELAGALPNARLVVFESSGHYPFLEEGERFATVVEAFLRET